MDPNNIQLTLIQKIKPTLNIIKKSPFVWVVSAFTIFALWNLFVASLLPVVIVHTGIFTILLDTLFKFGIGVLLHILACLFPFAMVVWWSDDRTGEKMYEDFLDIRRKEFLETKKEVLDNCEKEIFK